MIRRPQVLLMDEPLTNLDAKLRSEMRAELKHLQREQHVTTVYVTHDQVEAMALGDRITVMNKGRIQQVGTPMEVYRHPGQSVRGRLPGHASNERRALHIYAETGRPTYRPDRSI